jgi:hypothetical protein
MIFVNLITASICFLGSCYPALIGVNTPIGVFNVEHRSTTQYGYGGDVLMFKEGDDSIYSIHRIITFNSSQKRLERIVSNNIKDRTITDGCINVMPDVYEKLVECCSESELIISNNIEE